MLESRTQPGAPGALPPSHRLGTAVRALARAARALNLSAGLPQALADLADEAARAVGAEAAGVQLEGTVPADAVTVPLVWDDEVRGALWVRFPEGRTVDEEDLRVLEAMADLAVVACRNAEAYEHLQDAARTDALTGLFNHGAMQVRVREEIARARRDEHALSCVIIDLDDFKRVNDLKGHPAGDDYLRRVADAPARRGAAVRPGRALRRRRVRAAAARHRGGVARASPSACATACATASPRRARAAAARSASPSGSTA